MITLLLTLTLAAAPADRPAVLQVPATGKEAALLISFGVGFGDDFGLFGLTAQAQTALTQANRNLGLRSFDEKRFASGVRFSTALSRYQCHFALTGPKEGVAALGPVLLKALLRPGLDGASYARLVETASPNGVVASGNELFIQLLEPLLLKEPVERQRGSQLWHPVERTQQHIEQYFNANNVELTLVGLDAAPYEAALKSVRGGERPVRSPKPFATDVRQTIEASQTVHVFGIPLPPMTPVQVGGMRAITRAMHEALNIELRQAGLAYTVSADPVLTASFRGVFIVIPAYDASGLDLEPMLSTILYEVIHRKWAADDLARVVRILRAEDAEAAGDPQHLVQQLIEGRRGRDWSSPELQEALSSLTPELVSQVSKELFVNERSRFYVRFKDAPAPALGGPQQNPVRSSAKKGVGP